MCFICLSVNKDNISSPIGQDCTRKGGIFRPIGYDYAGMEGGFHLSELCAVMIISAGLSVGTVLSL